MASNSFLQHLSDLEFTNEEQGVVFTPTFQWDSTTDDSNLLIIGKLVSSRAIDDLAVVRAFQGIWKKIRGPWTIKDSWLALALFNPSINIDEYSFNSMNIYVHIYSIPLVFLDDDNIAHQLGDSLGAMIGKVIKINTRWIDLNIVNYLRVEIILDVTKPI
ncbi:hypothetical protein V6N12_076469 [Hibiscus sabdariffa]|uniref:DUF4283 domain-containing protein n=1 Tax=Hibiscus sabdariffa TaxID=183260 RepID=A0ABR2DAT5_9ROSI